MPEPRDPRQSPDEGDVFRKFGVLVRVTEVVGNCVYTDPALSHAGWLGLLFFQQWAEGAEVVGPEAEPE